MSSICPRKIFFCFLLLLFLAACADRPDIPAVPPSEAPGTEAAPLPSPHPSPEPPAVPSPEPSPEPTPEPTPSPWEWFSASFTEGSDPAALRFTYDIRADGQTVSEYLSPEPIVFKFPEYYSALPGVSTFRGNNFRSSPAWGVAGIAEETLTEMYRVSIGSLGRWTGVGWSGQPAIVQWDFEVQRQMNLLPGKKDKEGLIEVIQGAMDGYVYFFDLEDGQPTRNRLNAGNPIKGGISVDPRGVPLLYVGHGDNISGGRIGFLIYSLIDGKELFFINGRDSFAHRSWAAFDSNPLIDAPNDRMYLWGENGVLYNVKLNTDFDREAGTVSVSPEIIRYRFDAITVNQHGKEGSAAAFGQYMWAASNSGTIQCLDLATLTPVWVYDGVDDTDMTMVLDWDEEEQRLYLYSGCEVKNYASRKNPNGKNPQLLAYLRKQCAATGEVLWEHTYPCQLDRAVTGGAIATPVSGSAGSDISNIVVFWVAKLRGMGAGGALVAIDKRTGEIVWENLMPHYGWSSPVDVYTEDGKGYIVVCDSVGFMYLIRGTTGEILDRISLGSNVEASPAVWGNMIVVGTRGQRIIGVEIR